jgi:hypothetical protein
MSTLLFWLHRQGKNGSHVVIGCIATGQLSVSLTLCTAVPVELSICISALSH